MNDTAVRTIALKLFLIFYEAKEKLIKKKKEEEGMKTQEECIDSLTKAVNTAIKDSKPSGVNIFGKHISGWYFFSLMFLVFIFLGLFCYETFHMRDQAIQANVKLQVIRNDFGHHPAVVRTFHMLDSLYDNPIPPAKND